MHHQKDVKLIFLIIDFFLLTVIIAGCSWKPQSLPVNSTPADGGVTIRAMVVKLTQGEYTSVVKTGLEKPSIDDFKTMMIGVDIVGLDPTKDKTIICPDIGEITQKLSSGIVWSTHSSSTNNGADSVVSYNNVLVLHTKGISNDDLKLKLKGLKIQVSFTDLNSKKVEKIYDISDILQFV